MKNATKRFSSIALALAVALSLSLPAIALADTPTEEKAAGTITPATNCKLTLIYNEYPSDLAPGEQPDPSEINRLGERTISGLTKNQSINMWNYVVDIPGFFFYEGLPETLSISTDSSQNVITLYYQRSWDYEYTVNYYLMKGADLEADNWTDALAPEDVTFVKLGSQTFTDQPYDKLVDADAYVYKIDDAYYIDSYPSQITVGTDPDNNVINLLYVEGSSRLPDSFLPDDDSGSEDAGSSSNDATPTLPDDAIMSADQLKPLLPGGDGIIPDGMTEEQVNQLFADFLNTQSKNGPFEITDEMLANPVSPEVATATIAAYKAGLDQGMTDAGTVVPMESMNPLGIVAIVILAILAIVGFGLFFNERSKANRIK